MLHLSLLRLAKSDQRWFNLTTYQAHQLIWNAFPEKMKRPFLFHLQEHADHYGLLVQSTVAPDWSCIPGTEIGLKVIDPCSVTAGDRFRFSLRANPTVEREGYKDGKRRHIAVSANVELRKERAHARGVEVSSEDLDRETTLLQWLTRKGKHAGFKLAGSLHDASDRQCYAGPTVTYQVRRSRQVDLQHRRSSPPITIHGCDFTGALFVTDAAAFTLARMTGIGRAKAFGFGLLMLTPM